MKTLRPEMWVESHHVLIAVETESEQTQILIDISPHRVKIRTETEEHLLLHTPHEIDIAKTDAILQPTGILVIRCPIVGPKRGVK